MRLLTNKVNIMLAMIAAMFLAMFMLVDTAWGLTYQEGDVWIGTDGEQMTAEEASQWNYEIINSNKININKYNGEFSNGKIIGCIPATINGMSTTALINTFYYSEIKVAPEIPNTVTDMTGTFYGCGMLTEPSTIPASVTSIAQAYYSTAIAKTPQILSTNLRYASEAFAYCYNLVEITNIPVAEDISMMFYECGQLKVVPAIPEGIRALEWVFYNCKELEEIPEIPDSAYKLNGLFNGCSKLTGTMYLNDNVTIVDNMFDNTVEPIIVQYRNNTVVENTTFPSNVTKQKLTDEVIDPGDGDDQTTTTPSNTGETEGNLTIWGTVNPINMIDVTVPLNIEFIIESDRTFTGVRVRRKQPLQVHRKQPISIQ